MPGRRATAGPPPVIPQVPASPGRRAAIVALLALGVALMGVLFGRPAFQLVTLGLWGWQGAVVLLLAVAGLLAVPACFARVAGLLERTRAAVAAHRTAAAVVAGLVTAGYLLLAVHMQGRTLRPYMHDEFSFLIQAHQFARGHLWMPAHPLGDFFDSFQLFVSPVYASAYFPGTALVYVPGIWLHLPAWATTVAISAVVAGLLFRIVAELFDGPMAIVAVALLWADQQFRSCSTMVLGQMLLLACGLTATAAWLAWRTDHRRRWALLVGLALAWGAVTRPVDALCFALPIGLAMFACRPRVLPYLLVPAVPLLALQLMLNHGITGRWTQTPFGLYADREYPGTAYGFHPYDPAAHPASALPQKQALYNEYRKILQEHRPANILADQYIAHGAMPPRLTLTLTQLTTTPYALAIFVMPVALVGLTRRRAVVLATLPLFVVGYVPYAFFFGHYTLAVSASVIVAILAGAEQLPALAGPLARRVAVGVPLVVLIFALAALPELNPVNPGVTDDIFSVPIVDDAAAQIATLAHRPAIVLFAYDDPNRDSSDEPVYNATVAWPDDAEVVRAHDLGPARDADLFRYYAARQPARFVYRYSERTKTLTPLGPVTALVQP